MEILFKLILAHLIGDFLLQWRDLLAHKFERKFMSPYLYLHGVIHFVLGLALLWDLSWLLPMAVIAVSHTVIDGLKVSLSNDKNERLLFFVDQVLHVAIILAAWSYMTEYSVNLPVLIPHFWAHITALFFVTFPASIIIRVFFSKWPLPETAKESLAGVGAYIGFVERILIYFAVVSGHWSLVGFLIAAKSIFRFGDFSRTEERAYAEYLFVGTLLSLFMAVIAGLCFLALTGQTTSN